MKCTQSGVSTEVGEAVAASWKWYTIGGRPSITPPVLIASASPDAAVSSPPSNTESRQEDTPVRKRGRTDVLQYLRELRRDKKSEKERHKREK